MTLVAGPFRELLGLKRPLLKAALHQEELDFRLGGPGPGLQGGSRWSLTPELQPYLLNSAEGRPGVTATDWALPLLPWGVEGCGGWA